MISFHPLDMLHLGPAWKLGWSATNFVRPSRAAAGVAVTIERGLSSALSSQQAYVNVSGRKRPECFFFSSTALTGLLLKYVSLPHHTTRLVQCYHHGWS
jgi:hypothetical protein